MSDFFAGHAYPGPGVVEETAERNVVWGPTDWTLLKSINIATTAADAGNSPTTELRQGLLMGKVAASAEYEHYQPNGTTGVGVAEGVLWNSRRVIDTGGTATKRIGQLMVAGNVKAGQLLLLDQQARAQMANRFLFDDDLPGNTSGWLEVVAKAADYTVTAADNNRVFTNQGASALVTFTLPAIAKGLRYRFYSEDNDGIKITAATADTLVTHNDAAADTIAFSTTGRNIGAAFEILANADGTKWLVFPFIWNIADDGTTVSKATITT